MAVRINTNSAGMRATGQASASGLMAPKRASSRRAVAHNAVQWGRAMGPCSGARHHASQPRQAAWRRLRTASCTTKAGGTAGSNAGASRVARGNRADARRRGSQHARGGLYRDAGALADVAASASGHEFAAPSVEGRNCAVPSGPASLTPSIGSNPDAWRLDSRAPPGSPLRQRKQHRRWQRAFAVAPPAGPLLQASVSHSFAGLVCGACLGVSADNLGRPQSQVNRNL